MLSTVHYSIFMYGMLPISSLLSIFEYQGYITAIAVFSIIIHQRMLSVIIFITQMETACLKGNF